jgi:predicted DNA-binding transcriptional regulator AlpA
MPKLKAVDPIAAAAAAARLPKFIRYKDLEAMGLMQNRAQLGRLIDGPEAFPPGRLIGANSRVWTLAEVEAWIATRPTARLSRGPVARAARIDAAAADDKVPA